MSDDRSRISALLGPTNTGKTHRAVERMLEHSSGMIGLPLRLLAREIYDRITAVRGEQQVALVTGEEKRIPARPRYWVCTVESMPVDREVDFLAVDEIQLAEHPQRGHKFTERLLNARGRRETWFMGADTMRPLVEQLVPTAEIHRHARLSHLHAVDATSLSLLPPRTAVIAFTANELYQLAERLRQKRGGAAVVLGALSPRTRNAQVAMYQAGEVDFMVATDAIGMGLNMDIDQVAFASTRKFDGQRRRALSAAELGQIAGRAGRHLRDGTFGAIKPAQLSAELAFSIERHRFAPVRKLVWRNCDLDFSSVESLLASLKVRPKRRCLRLVEQADDFNALHKLIERPEIKQAARGSEAVSLLWEVCRIPDFRKLLLDQHAALLGEVFMQLSRPKGELDETFLDERIRRLENDQGPIETLMMRMEFIRTWSYIVHHPGWLADPMRWKERTQAAEDRLSQALHERLTERFVERRGRVGGRARKRTRSRKSVQEQSAPGAEEPLSGPFSQLSALRDALPSNEALVLAADDQWIDTLSDAQHEQFEVDGTGNIRHAGNLLARVVRGSDLLHPEVKLLLDEIPGAGAELRLMRRMRAWVRDLVGAVLAPLHSPALDELSGPARGLLYQLEKQLGTVETKAARTQLETLSDAERQQFAQADVVLGDRFVYARAGLGPALVHQRAVLCGAWAGVRVAGPDGHRPSVVMDKRGWSKEMYLATGYATFGPRAIRVDVCDRIDAGLKEASQAGRFAPPAEISGWLECTMDEVEQIIIAFGYHATVEGFVRPRRRRRRSKSARRRKKDMPL